MARVSKLLLTMVGAILLGSLLKVGSSDVWAFDIDTATKDLMKQLDSIASKGVDFGDKTVIYERLDETKKIIDDFNKVIYRYDDRVNYVDAASYERRAADATAVIVGRSALVPNGTGEMFSLPDRGAGLCTPDQAKALGFENERFFSEPAPGGCSAFKISDTRIATAAHCIPDQRSCEDASFVFRFYVDGTGKNPTKEISKLNVFHCKALVKAVLTDSGPDWGIVEVDRPMKDIPTVTVRSQGSPEPDAGLTVVGYPLGLPVKIAGNGKLRRLGDGYFEASLDTYGGNSGSAVFSSSHLRRDELFVEGILVRGENDFETENPCRISKRCPEEGCRGEDVTLATEFANRVAN